MDDVTPQPDVGRSLRDLREERGLTLRALADLSGVSLNAISKIERGENSPTVASLHKLALALSVPITELFARSSVSASILVRRDKRPALRTRGMRIESLGTGLPGQRIEPFMIRIEPGEATGEGPISHGGQELLVCTQGVFECRVGEEHYRLEEGDSLLFLAEQSHVYRNTERAVASAFCVIQAPDEVMRVSRERHLMSAADAGGGPLADPQD